MAEPENDIAKSIRQFNSQFTW